MMKVVLFALVCVSFAQVYGASIEEEIKSALQFIDSLNQYIVNNLEHNRQDFPEIKNGINSKVTNNIKAVTKYQDESVLIVRNMSQALVKIAKEENRPQSVIACITIEESVAIARMKTATNKFGSDAKKSAAEKLVVLAQLEKDLTKVEETRKVVYKRAVEDVKKCKNSNDLNLTVSKFEGDMHEVEIDSGDIRDAKANLLLKFEREISVYTLNVNALIATTKNLAVRNMRNCSKKTA